MHPSAEDIGHEGHRVEEGPAQPDLPDPSGSLQLALLDKLNIEDEQVSVPCVVLAPEGRGDSERGEEKHNFIVKSICTCLCGCISCSIYATIISNFVNIFRQVYRCTLEQKAGKCVIFSSACCKHFSILKHINQMLVACTI